MRMGKVHLLRSVVPALILAIYFTASHAATGGGGNLAPRGEPPITAVWQPLNKQLEVLFVANDGSIRDTWKANNQAWFPPTDLAPPGSAPPHAHVSVVWQAEDEVLEAFWVGAEGAVHSIWKAHNQPWKAPVSITAPGFSAPGAPLASVWQPVRHELLVFGLGGDGRLNSVWKKNETNWTTSQMTGAGFGVSGAQIGAIYQPLDEHVEVFAADGQGAIHDEWKARDGNWSSGTVTGNSAAPPGASLSAAWEPTSEHLEVFFVDANGGYNTVWKQRDGPWQVLKIGPPNVAPPGAPLSGAWEDVGQHLEVFSIGKNGAIEDLWKQKDGAWNGPLASAAAGSGVGNGDIAALLQPNPSQLEVFYWDAKGQLWDSWKIGNDAWAPPLRLSDPGGTNPYTLPYCQTYWRSVYEGHGAVDINKINECAPLAPLACKSWRMGPPQVYILSDDKDVVSLQDNIVHDSNAAVFTPTLTGGLSTFGGIGRMYYDGFGASKQSIGQIYGSLSPQDGSLNLKFNIDGQLREYTGKPVALGIIPGEKGLLGFYKGYYFDPLHAKFQGYWSSPVTGFEDKSPVGVCHPQDINLGSDVTFTPQPVPPQNTGPAVNPGLGVLNDVNAKKQGGLSISDDPNGSWSKTSKSRLKSREPNSNPLGK
jgi:hypothetical protein